MNIEVTILTALVTLVVLAAVSWALVVRYMRLHAESIRESLMTQAHKYEIASPETLNNNDLMHAIRAAKREQKHRRITTA